MLSLFDNKSYMVSCIIANATDDVFCFVSGIVIYTYDATVFLAVEQSGLGPAYEERNVLL